MSEQHSTHYDANNRQLICCGDWNLIHIEQLKQLLAKIDWPSSGDVTIDAQKIAKMDSAGAWLIDHLHKQLQERGLKVNVTNYSSEHENLTKMVQDKLQEETKPPRLKKPGLLAVVGDFTVKELGEFQEYLAFIGKLTFEAIRIAPNFHRWRWKSLSGIVYSSGFQGLPIIALLSFLIGVVLTYQMGLQLRNYGASIYIVDLLGLSVLREFAPLITAIMVAGRTGSAFTASIGMMKLNQEIDALDTMGVTPAELLLLPRIIGLFISLPLLVMWSDIWGVFGGMVMSNNMLSITWYDFLHRFPHVIPLRSFIIGLGKAPVFALIIASIGCFQGMKVKNSADSVGQNTTRSVVLAIFFIIVADAVFSIIFSKMKI